MPSKKQAAAISGQKGTDTQIFIAELRIALRQVRLEQAYIRAKARFGKQYKKFLSVYGVK